jgi:predicted nucleotidyltransferase
MVSAMDTGATTPDLRIAERDRIVAQLREAAPRLRALGVDRLWLFGSMARGEAAQESDVDVMIAIPPGRKFSLFDLGEVRVDLCELLGREVDVVIEEDLRPDFRRDITLELVRAF